jgi:hypothetical protein
MEEARDALEEALGRYEGKHNLTMVRRRLEAGENRSAPSRPSAVPKSARPL